MNARLEAIHPSTTTTTTTTAASTKATAADYMDISDDDDEGINKKSMSTNFQKQKPPISKKINIWRINMWVMW